MAESQGTHPVPGAPAPEEDTVSLPIEVEDAVKQALRGVVDDDKVSVVIEHLSHLIRLETRHVPDGTFDIEEIEFLDKLAPDAHFADQVAKLTLRQAEIDLMRQEEEIEGRRQERNDLRDLQKLAMKSALLLGFALVAGAVASAYFNASAVGVALAGAAAAGMVAKFLDAGGDRKEKERS
ncbi:MAG: hypothetical protein H7841_11800 [Magnetospirillum sp. WYHS-4]